MVLAVAVGALPQDRPALVLGVGEVAEQHVGVGGLEIVLREFLLVLQEHVAIGDLVVALAAVEVEVVDVLDALHIHGEALEAVGDLARDRACTRSRRPAGNR